MKKQLIGFVFVVSMALIIGIITIATAAGFSPQAGLYYAYKSKGTTFHIYTSPLAEGASASVIIETANTLVLQDVQQAEPNNADLKALIASLDKPLRRIYLSHNHDHHWIGLEAFEGVPVYADAGTIRSIREQGMGLLADARKKFGEKMVPYTKIIVPGHELRSGEEVLDGVRFIYFTPFVELTGPVIWTEFPEQHVLIQHHLAYNGVQLPVPPIGARMDVLKKLQSNRGYEYVISGHGIPSNAAEYFDATLGYYAKLGEIIKGSPDVASAKEKLLKAYPNWGGVFFLDMMLPAYYKK
jgi:hypothetical protein